MGSKSLQTVLGGSLLTKNSIINLLGLAVPIVAAAFAIPLLISGLGTDRFGILTLAWMVIGYFTLFDLGLGRALTQTIAATLTHDRRSEAAPIVWIAIGVMFLFGFIGTLVMGVTAPWLVTSVLKVPAPLEAETLRSFYILAIGIPFVVASSGFIGILSAFQRFGLLNAIRIPAGLLGLLAPLAILPFSHSLVPIIVVLVAARIAASLVYAIACWRVSPHSSNPTGARYSDVKPLFQFGAWMTVTNIAGPLMVYLDRFVIGATVSMAAVAYYATPYEMVTKLLIVPAAILAVLFPAFAASFAQDRRRLLDLFVRGTKYITVLLFPVILVIVAFGGEGIRWWLGSEFARHSTLVLQCLAIGVFANAIAQVFATMIQGIGRPDLGAKLHLIELPLYVPALLWGVRHHGIMGASVVWTGRVLLDGILLMWISSRVLQNETMLFRRMGLGLMSSLIALIVPIFIASMIARTALVAVLVVVFLVIAWFGAFGENERAMIRNRLRFVGAD